MTVLRLATAFANQRAGVEGLRCAIALGFQVREALLGEIAVPIRPITIVDAVVKRAGLGDLPARSESRAAQYPALPRLVVSLSA